MTIKKTKHIDKSFLHIFLAYLNYWDLPENQFISAFCIIRLFKKYSLEITIKKTPEKNS